MQVLLCRAAGFSAQAPHPLGSQCSRTSALLIFLMRSSAAAHTKLSYHILSRRVQLQARSTAATIASAMPAHGVCPRDTTRPLPLLQVGCIVNDVASVNIDAKLIRGAAAARDGADGVGPSGTTADLADTIELANGCACCRCVHAGWLATTATATHSLNRVGWLGHPLEGAACPAACCSGMGGGGRDCAQDQAGLWRACCLPAQAHLCGQERRGLQQSAQHPA